MKSIIKKVVFASLASSVVIGCSSSPDKIAAKYVSPLQYQPYDCEQVQMELMRVNRKVIEVTGVQQKEANSDAVAMGVGLVLFWPALFFLAGDDSEQELGQLKGEYQALETVAIQKKCDVADTLIAAREKRDKAAEIAKKKLEQQEAFIH